MDYNVKEAMDFVVQSILDNVELEQEDTEPKNVIQIQETEVMETNETKNKWRQCCQTS